MELSKGELTLLRYIRENHLENTPEDTIIISGMSGREIASALSWLQSKGYVALDVIVGFNSLNFYSIFNQ